MATVADQLRRARESAGLTVVRVADITKMRADHVRALEEGNYDVFVAPVYIRGFVRTYARLVRVDEADIMTLLEQELAQTAQFREHPSLTGPERSPLDVVMLQLSRIDWRIALPATVVVLAAGLTLWINHTLQDRRRLDPAHGVLPGRYEPLQALGGDTLPLPPVPTPRR